MWLFKVTWTWCLGDLPAIRPCPLNRAVRCAPVHCVDTLMPRSQMAYDVSAAPLRPIFPQFLAMIVQFYGGRQDGSCDNCCCCGGRRQSSAELNMFLEIARIAGLGLGRWRRAGMVPAGWRCRAMFVQFLQDFSGYYGAVKDDKSAWCAHECWLHPEGLVR